MYTFSENTPVSISQEKFLSNYENKSEFIDQLKVQLQKQFINCYQDEGEADGLVVDIAMEQASYLKTLIVAEDVDILVILTARATEKKEILVLKLGKQNAPSAIYTPKSFEINYPNSSKLIAFSHAFTGCDTVSAFFNKGKMKFLDLVEKRTNLREKAEIFYSATAEPSDVLEAGRYCAIYGTAKGVKHKNLRKIDNYKDFLEQMRYECFIKATTKNSAVKLSSLIPTVDALDEHSKRC